MNKLFSYLTLVLSVSLITVACKTDFDINAPYKAVPVIYGLIDQSLDTQFVKINKSFIGGGNNIDYAAINDSIMFNNVSARVDQYSVGSSFAVESYPLQELWVDNLDDGIFYTDSQKVFFFIPTSPLNDEDLYRLVVSVDELAEDITAETYLIDGSGLKFDYLFSLSLGINGLSLADVNLGTSDIYYNPQIKWKTAPKGKRYELLMSFRYDEITNNGTSPKTIYWNLGSQNAIGSAGALNGGDDMYKSISGQAFYEMIASRLDGYSNEQAVLKRKIKAVDFVLSTGNEDLNTYMEVNEPATGVVTERPSFTNISGGGIGLFGSKYQIVITGNLTDGSVLELCKSQLTSGFKFCTDSTDQITAISNLTGGENCGCN